MTPHLQKRLQTYLTLDCEDHEIPAKDREKLDQLVRERKAVVDHIIRETAGRHTEGQIATALKEAGFV